MDEKFMNLFITETEGTGSQSYLLEDIRALAIIGISVVFQILLFEDFILVMPTGRFSRLKVTTYPFPPPLITKKKIGVRTGNRT